MKKFLFSIFCILILLICTPVFALNNNTATTDLTKMGLDSLKNTTDSPKHIYIAYTIINGNYYYYQESSDTGSAIASHLKDRIKNTYGSIDNNYEEVVLYPEAKNKNHIHMRKYTATMESSGWKQDSKGWYYIDKNYDRVTNQILPSGSQKFYLGNDGYVVKGEVISYNGNLYYFDSSTGAMKTSGSISDPSTGQQYKVNANGTLTRDTYSTNSSEEGMAEEYKKIFKDIAGKDIKTYANQSGFNSAPSIGIGYFKYNNKYYGQIGLTANVGVTTQLNQLNLEVVDSFAAYKYTWTNETSGISQTFYFLEYSVQSKNKSSSNTDNVSSYNNGYWIVYKNKLTYQFQNGKSLKNGTYKISGSRDTNKGSFYGSNWNGYYYKFDSDGFITEWSSDGKSWFKVTYNSSNSGTNTQNTSNTTTQTNVPATQIMSVLNCLSGFTWKQDSSGWWIENGSGAYPVNGWALTTWNGKQCLAQFNSSGYNVGTCYYDNEAVTFAYHGTLPAATLKGSSSNTNTQPQTNTTTNNNVINQPSNNSQPQQIQIEGQNTQSHDFANSIKQSDNTTNIIDTSKLSSAGSNAAQMLMQAAGITSDFANSTGNIANTNDNTVSDTIPGGSSNSTKLVEMSEIDELFDDEGKFNGEMLQSNGTATVTQQPKTPNGGGSWDNWANNDWDYYSINKKTTDTKGVWIKYGNSYYYATEASEILTYSTEKKDNQKVSGQYVVQTLIDEGIYCIDKKLYKFDDTGKMIVDDQTDTNGALKGNKGTITLKADGKLDKGHEIVLDESELTWTIHENDTKNGPCFKNSKFIIEYEDSKNYTYLYEDGYAILKTNDSYALYKIISGKASKVSSAGNTVSKIKTYLDKGSYKESTETAEVKDNKTTTPTSTTNTSNTNNTTTNNTNNTTTTSSKTTANIDNNYVSNGKFYNSKDSKTYTVNSDGIITNIEDGNKGSTTGNYEVVDYGGTSFLKKV